jgi:hypothetical protein
MTSVQEELYEDIDAANCDDFKIRFFDIAIFGLVRTILESSVQIFERSQYLEMSPQCDEA